MPSPALCSMEKTQLLHQGLMSLQRAVLSRGLWISQFVLTHTSEEERTHRKMALWTWSKALCSSEDMSVYHPPVVLEITTSLDTLPLLRNIIKSFSLSNALMTCLVNGVSNASHIDFSLLYYPLLPYKFWQRNCEWSSSGEWICDWSS